MFEQLRSRAVVRGATSFRRYFVVFLGSTLVQMLSGCIFSSERPPDLSLDVPPNYRAGQGQSAPPALDWWRGFRSTELTKLIEEAQTANLDIAAAIGRIMQADATAKIAGAPLLPGVDFAGSAARLRPPGGPSRDDYRVALNASYEIDFWGKNRAASLAAAGKRHRPPLRPRKSSSSPRSPALPPPISRCSRRRTGCGSRAITWTLLTACSR